MPSFILAIDQGTTSSRAILFDKRCRIRASAQREFRQHYPNPGWVEHEPEDLWKTTIATCPRGAAQGRRAGQGDRRARHHQSARNDHRLGPQDRQSHPPGDRMAGPANGRSLCGPEAGRVTRRVHRQDRACCSIPISPGPRLPGFSIMFPDARDRAERGELAFGTVDSYLIWRLTGGSVHATDATNASRTLLFNIHNGDWDDASPGAAARSPGHVAASQGLGGEFRRHAGEASGRPASPSWAPPAISRPPPSARHASGKE